MATKAFIPKTELFSLLRGAVRRQENVAFKIVTDPVQHTILVRLSGGNLVYVNCEGLGPLDALVVLGECQNVRFTYASVDASKRRALMSPDAFLKWIDGAEKSAWGDSDIDLNPPPHSSSPSSVDARWSGTLRGGQAKKSTAGSLAAVLAIAAVIIVGMYVLIGRDDPQSLEAEPANRDETEVSASPSNIAQGTYEQVPASIDEATTLQAGRTYLLDGLVFVEPGNRLAIEPGVTVLGGPGSALVITRGATIHARGTRRRPIVFTSANHEGSRDSGDWGGVVLLGNAPINSGEGSIEGVPAGDHRALFGGNEPDSNCGVLEYVRVEFAGFTIGTDDELNGLTLGGCGSATYVRHVQVHRAHDDGIEIFGGTVDLKFVLVTHARDDSIDWDLGWTGRGQFLIVQKHPEMGDAGFEGDNSKDNPAAIPVSRPRLYNVTMVGFHNVNANHRAMLIRRGSGGEFRNFLIAGFPIATIQLQGVLTSERVASGMLGFGSIAIVEDTPGVLPDSTPATEEIGFNAQHHWFEDAPDIIRDSTEPLPASAWDLNQPSFIPIAPFIGAGSDWSPPADEAFWDRDGDYYGAVRYGVDRDWTHGWTAFPES